MTPGVNRSYACKLVTKFHGRGHPRFKDSKQEEVEDNSNSHLKEV